MPKPLPTWRTADIDELDRFSNVRLIALDADGTLLENSADGVSREIRYLGNSIRHFGGGVVTTIATGRALTSAARLIQTLGGNREIPVIVYNGALVVIPQSGSALYHQTIPSDAVTATMYLAARLNLRSLAYTIGESFAGIAPDPVHEVVYGYSGHPEKPLTEFNGLDVRWLETPEARYPSETTAVLLDPGEGHINSEVFARLSDIRGISITSSGGRYIEIRPIAANKGAALQHIAELRGIERRHVLALGDNDNDTEMLQWAGIGIAVGIASSAAAVSSAEYVCRYGPTKAAIEVLRLVRNSRRLAKGVPLRDYSEVHADG